MKLIPEPVEGDLYAHYIKEYDLTVAAGTAYVDYLIDLVAPNRFDGGQVEVDLTDWVADVTEEANQNPAQIQPIRKELKGYSELEPPLTEDDVMSFAPHELMGIGHIERLTFSGITNGAELKFDKLYVALEADKTNEDKEALLTISPVFQESIVWAAAAEEGATEEEIAEAKKYHPEGKRILGGLANFKAAVDGAYAHRGAGYKGTTFPTISDMLSQVTNANTVAGLTISDGYQPTVGNPHHIRGNDHYLSLWLSPVLWDTTEGDIRIYDYKIKPEVPNQDTLIVQARPAMDIWNVYPGIGNPQGDYGGAYPYRFISVLGALIQGITYNKNSRRPAAGIPVEVYQQGPSAEVKVGTFTSNKHHFWRSSRLRTDRLYEPLSALARVDNSAIEDTWRSYMLCRRQHWASVIGPVPVTGGRPAVDHEKATGRTFVVNSADAGLTLYKSEDMGQTWPNPLVITDTEGYGPGAVAVSHGTCLRPIWVVAADSEGAFKCLTSGDDGGTWAMVTIVSGVTVAVAPSLKWNETRGILSATYAKEGSTYLVESPDMGQTWGTPVAILEAEAAGAITSINSNGLLAFVAIDDNGDLICKHSGDRGGSWT